MKLLRIALALFLIAGRVALLGAPCHPQGDSKYVRIQQLDVLKNRTLPPGIPLPAVHKEITLASILAPGDDTDRFSRSQVASITGYVVLVKSGGAETCNCHAADEARHDVHIEIAARKGESNERKVMVVEVTPAFRKAIFGRPPDLNVELNTASQIRKILVGKQVTVTGQMFFDDEHRQNAINTNPHGRDLWRATCWEIHPVFELRLSR